ncbi:ATP-binding protein [Burkholderia ubonensis]|uniref:histidine kinase n=1 Tax=Burkholderia ubonensis TaxID=101571 RepID=A0ABD6Q197_9BURK|nr:ATP-binding protein [Burkholderia ubonensis]KVT42184.1 histidine kinase [Burkholderia ubonensis]OJA45205.1 two-component sensor histidine kinase [Burkholderia ubonensis]
MTSLRRALMRWSGASLRRRLLFWLLPAACVIGLLASAGTYWGALRELDDLLDDQMRSMTKQIVVGPNGELSFSGDARGKHRFKVDDPDAVLLQVWRNGTLVYSTDRDLTLPPPAQGGIASVDVGGQSWRTYVTERGGTTIRVAQARHARWEAIAGIAVHLLWPVLSMLPVLAIGLWFGIGAGLRPLRLIAAGLKRRNANNLEPVDVASMPNEVRPLAEAINDLLARLDRSFTLQRHFIADAAHELRTPIMGLSIQSQLLRRAATPDERERILAQIHAGTTRLGHLAEQLLTLARIEPDAQTAAFAPVDLAALCRAVVADRARVADAHRVDLGAIGASPVTVAGNADTLRVLLNNLVDNAIRYAGDGACIDVSARVDGATPVLEVSDDGPGIPEAERADVWERFYRGAGAQAATSSGSGLGLSIVKRIAEQHRATVTLGTSAGGRGLTVTVRFNAPA